jgi:hypothetical protein
VFPATVLASRYCTDDPAQACLADTDCAAGSCVHTRYSWGASLATTLASGVFQVAPGLDPLVADRFAGSVGLDELYLDNEFPTAGSGFWYLARLECPAGDSWQTVVGAEPARDQVLP